MGCLTQNDAEQARWREVAAPVLAMWPLQMHHASWDLRAGTAALAAALLSKPLQARASAARRCHLDTLSALAQD